MIAHARSRASSFAGEAGGRTLGFLRELGGVALLLRDVVRDVAAPPFYFRLLVEQIYHIGVKSLGLIVITAASTGMVMALQFGLGLEKFGGRLYVPKIVSLSIVREIGPVFCSLMLAARVGAGIASEIGSMVVTQQIDAIRALGTSPIRRIVVPRILGCLIALPLLATIGDVVGVLGAMLVCTPELGLDPSLFFQKALGTITIKDYLAGIVKTMFFALFLSLVSCYCGLNVKGGTRGVGIATTLAVVASSILILVSDYFLTKAFFILFES